MPTPAFPGSGPETDDSEIIRLTGGELRVVTDEARRTGGRRATKACEFVSLADALRLEPPGNCLFGRFVREKDSVRRVRDIREKR